MVKAWLYGRQWALLLGLVAGIVLQTPNLAKAEPGAWELWIQGGWSFANEDESFNKYDVYGTYGLPWNWQWWETIRVDTNLTAAASLLDAGDDTGLAGSLGFEIVFGSASGECPLALRVGEAVTVLSEVEIGAEDFGGPVQFTTHIGLTCRLLAGLSVMVQGQHVSNGGLYSKNPGINTVMVGVAYRF